MKRILLFLFCVWWAAAAHAQTPAYPVGSEPTVVSDKDDYAPGEVAIITGSGWTLDTSVRIHIDEEPHYDHHNDFDIQVREDGSWMLEFPIDERHLGVAFHLEVTGNVTGYVAETFFTDGNVTFSVGGLPSGASANVSYQYTQATGQPTAITGSDNTVFTIASRNNNDVFFSYPETITYDNEKYNLSSVVVSQGTLQSGNSLYDFRYNSPSQARTITGNYILCPKPTIEPVLGQTVIYGTNTEFIVSSNSTSSLTHQWQVDSGNGFENIPSGGIYSGVNAATLSLTKPTVAMSGYKYRVVVANDCGEVTSDGTATLTVNAKEVFGAFTVENKTYDGTTEAEVLTRTLNGVLDSDEVALIGGTAGFADKNVDNDKVVTPSGMVLSGNDADNYTLTTIGTATADITPATLVIGISAQDKVYDGNVTASTTASISSGLISGDDVDVSSNNGEFDDKNVGNDKEVTADVAKSGSDAGNYIANATAIAQADITPAQLVIGISAEDKVYDGKVTASTTASISSGLISGDDVDVSSTNGEFDDKNVGTDKEVTASYNFV
ncbi:YDG domain-containing protein [Litoribacter populi]|uniref:YDG domain-containing protein n=1 Tax=Litoribacter populi TaxID=2598460 RepID=UPI0011802A14|nr:YDG domain-containing protein [Litoribacter populi]